MNTAAAARRFAEVWTRGWREHDVDAVAALYAPGCSFRSEPFRELDEPRRYAAWAFADENAADVRFGEPIVAGDRAVVEYWAVSTSADGAEETIAGASLLRFAPDGLVAEQHDYWNVAPGRHDAPPGWGQGR